MKKVFLFPSFILLLFTTVLAQKAAESNESFAKKEPGNAITLICEGDPSNVEAVIKERLKKVKGSGKIKGNFAHEGVVIEDFSPKTLDYYYRVDKAGENQSKIIFFVSFGNNNFMSSKDDAACITNIKTALESMVADIRRYEIQLAIEAQEKVLADAVKTQEEFVKDLAKLAEDQVKMEKELAECKASQAANLKTQEAQKLQIEEEKKVLSELQTKLGSLR